ncbi:outer membrane lipoprotein carrier protein LolA [Candidatus Poribacteria bacterium]|nr:outer membrane lipoprotein carrier protein LolA [Candidatus Poribacteria bacterium]
MKGNKVKILIVLILIFKINLIYAETAQQIVKKVKDKFAGAKTITANFKQSIYSASLKNKKEIYGIFKIKRPDKLLMTYDKPKDQRQKIVINNNNFWLYLENTNEVMKKTLHDAGNEVDKQIFPWMENIDYYDIQVLTEKEKYIELSIIPTEKIEDKFKKFIVHVDQKKWIIIYTYMLDLSDNIVEFNFSDIELNENILNNEFEFTVPKGAEVLKSK